MANPKKYQTLTARGVLSAVGTEVSIKIKALSDMLWLTDLMTSIIDANGIDVLSTNIAMDDICVSLIVGDSYVTHEPIPLRHLASNNNELFAGYILPPNAEMTFRFEAKRLPAVAGSPENAGKSKYPLAVAISLKGYGV